MLTENANKNIVTLVSDYLEFLEKEMESYLMTMDDVESLKSLAEFQILSCNVEFSIKAVCAFISAADVLLD